jgi:hypothetical protein
MNAESELKFLESFENVKGSLSPVVKREVNTNIARGVATFIQQGRMFYESASQVPLEIRPLPLFYGTMAFSRAMIAGRTLLNPSAMSQSHGLSDTTSHNSRVAEMTVRCEESGTFADFNNVVCELEGMHYFDEYMSKWHVLPTAPSSELASKTLTFKEILSRISSLRELYARTFDEPSRTMPATYFSESGARGVVPRTTLRLDLRELFDTHESLIAMVESVREKYPVLKRWRFFSAQKAWDNTILIFDNAKLADYHRGLHASKKTPNGTVELESIDHEGFTGFLGLLDPPCCGLIQEYSCLTTTFDGLYVAEASLLYAGIYLLGSLVRYNPQIWVHSVSRLASHERPADDQALALIEGFMDTVAKAFPTLTFRVLTREVAA